MNRHIRGSLQRAAFAIVFGFAMLGLSYHVSAQEVTSGMTVRDSGFTGGEHYELTWYTADRDWRAGLTYTNTQTFGSESYLDCGYLCVWKQRPIVVKAYASGYVQRLLTYRAVYGAVGLSVHEERKPLLGTEYSFRLSAGWKVDKHWSVEYTHMSNAGTARYNGGQDLLLIRYGW